MPAENAGRAFALVLVDELARQGVRHAVVAPGSRSTPIALALLESSSITVHVRVDERSAAYLALGLAKASGAVVPVLCTSGTAASYFHGAVMEADLASVPLLVLTADRPPELHGIGANQTVDQVGLYGTAARWAPDVPTPESSPESVASWRALVAQAARACLGLDRDQPAGPVHLNLPLREPLVAVDDSVGFPYDLDLDLAADIARDEPPGDPPAASFDAPAELVERLRGVERGVVVAGGWAAGGVDALVTYAEQAGWPIIAEPHSNARHGDNALRATDALLRDDAFVGSHRPDLVVVVGRVGLARPLLTWLAAVPHVVISPDGQPWDVTRSALAVIATPVEALRSTQPVAADPAWLAGWRAAAHFAGQAIDALIEAGPRLTEPRVARDVAMIAPTGSALVVSSSMPIRDLDLVMPPRGDLTIWANRGVSGIDGFVSSALGVALARGSTAPPTIGLCGDLSLLHDINGLMPSGEPRPDVTLVVINNNGGGIFSLLPQGSAVEPSHFERLFGTPHGASIEHLAAAYDVPYQLVETAEELATALSTYPGLRIIEVRTDRAGNTALHDQLRAITPSPETG